MHISEKYHRGRIEIEEKNKEHRLDIHVEQTRMEIEALTTENS